MACPYCHTPFCIKSFKKMVFLPEKRIRARPIASQSLGGMVSTKKSLGVWLLSLLGHFSMDLLEDAPALKGTDL